MQLLARFALRSFEQRNCCILRQLFPLFNVAIPKNFLCLSDDIVETTSSRSGYFVSDQDSVNVSDRRCDRAGSVAHGINGLADSFSGLFDRFFVWRAALVAHPIPIRHVVYL